MKRLFLILSIVLLSACSSNAASVPGKAWYVGVTMPSFYPVKITQIYGVNEKENWTVLIHNIIPRMSDSDIEYIRNRFPEYDGFGLPHALGITSRNQIGIGTNHLPDTLYVHWVSLFDTKFYVTKYDIPDNVKQLSATEVSYTRSDGAVFESCYRTRFVFGLLPNGRAKVWLSDCGETIYLTELAPDQTPDRDSNGFKADTYKESSYLRNIQQRAKDAGVELEPIPWDKVNKVYSINEIKTLDE